MPTLRLRLVKCLDGDALPAVVYGELRGPEIRGARPVMLPVGEQDVWHEERVATGRYHLQVTLPSGDLVARDIDVPAGVAPIEVAVELARSDHEHLSWAHFLGAFPVDLAGGAEQARERRLRGDPTSSLANEQLGYAVIDAVNLGAARLELVSLDSSGTETTRLPVFDGMPVPMGAPGETIPYTARYAWGAESFVVQLAPPPEARDAPVPRARPFLCLDGVPGGPWVAALPLPWSSTLAESASPARLDVVLHRPLGARDPEATRLRVILRDDVVSTLLGYLQSGRLTAVAALREQFLREAEQLLYRKAPCPFGAAAGALLLLRTQAYDRLHDWPFNLANSFPWLPDGAVVAGWCRLLGLERGRVAPARAEVEETRPLFLEAARRGVPVFAEGLRLLIDGLKQCLVAAEARKEPHGDLRRALRRMRAFAAASDLAQPFAVFRGRGPGEPQPDHVYGFR